MQKHSAPSFFQTRTTGLVHGLADSWITSPFNISSHKVNGTLRGIWCIGWLSAVSITCSIPLNAKRGYWQIRVQKESQVKIAFVTFDGLYEFRIISFGLCNTPAMFQRLMQRALVGMSKFCSVYIDDILVFSENVDEHIGHLRQTFSHLCQVGLKLHPQKCILVCPEVPYLGYVISAEGILPRS